MPEASTYIDTNIPYSISEGIPPVDPDKYSDRQKNEYETQRRASELDRIQLLSDAVCDDLGVEKVQLAITGSVAAGYAIPTSDLDLFSTIEDRHPLIMSREILKIYSKKMQFLLHVTGISFPVYIVFYKNIS